MGVKRAVELVLKTAGESSSPIFTSGAADSQSPNCRFPQRTRRRGHRQPLGGAGRLDYRHTKPRRPARKKGRHSFDRRQCLRRHMSQGRPSAGPNSQGLQRGQPRRYRREPRTRRGRGPDRFCRPKRSPGSGGGYRQNRMRGRCLGFRPNYPQPREIRALREPHQNPIPAS